MTLLFVTGSQGSGIAQVAAGAALALAERGQRTLLVGFGPAHTAPMLFGATSQTKPQSMQPLLDVLALDLLAGMSNGWKKQRTLWKEAPQISGEELPVVPGSDVLFGLGLVRDMLPAYGHVVIDAGPHEALLRALTMTDSLRWGTRVLFGLDRDPGRSQVSLGRALLPTSFIPFDVRDGVQTFRVNAEASRDALLANDQAAAWYVLRPDVLALDEAQVAVPALQLCGLPVAGVLVGPMLPTDIMDNRLQPLAEAEQAVIAQASATWPEHVVHGFGHTSATPPALASGGAAALAAVPITASAPIGYSYQNNPAVVIDLPGLPRDALSLTISGDELVVRIGPYRRHVLLPPALRGIGAIRATRDGNQLVVRRRA